MSSSTFSALHEKLGSNVGLILDVPSSSLGISKRKWHSAFITIYCSRAFLSLQPSTLPKHTNTTFISRTLSYSILTVEPVTVPIINGFKTDQQNLTELVKEKNLNELLELGGVAELASALKTDAEHGINGDDDEDIARRHEAYGSNTYKKPPTQGFLHFVWEAFKDLTILILLGCAALSLGFGIKEHGLKEGWIDGGSICLAVILVISVSAISNYRQSRQFDKLSKVSNNLQIEAVRNGRRQLISIFEIVVGDVICLKIGDQVPADGLLLDGHSLSVDESSMTGESDHVEISVAVNPFLFSGTKIADGYGRMLVTSVGMNTNWGAMMSQISQDSSEKTPLQARLDKLTSSIGKVGLAIAFFVLVVMLVRYFTGNTKDEAEILEGDGGPGTIKKITFGEGSHYGYVKHKIHSIDKVNHTYSYSLIEGDALSENIEKIDYETKLVSAPHGGTIIKTTSKYHTKGDVEIKEEHVKAGKEKAAHLFKLIEGYLKDHPSEYN